MGRDYTKIKAWQIDTNEYEELWTKKVRRV